MPDDWPELGEHGPDVVDFGDGWLWLDDLTKAAKSGMDWRAWNALHPNKPKGPNGRWVKAGTLGDLLNRHEERQNTLERLLGAVDGPEPETPAAPSTTRQPRGDKPMNIFTGEGVEEWLEEARAFVAEHTPKPITDARGRIWDHKSKGLFELRGGGSAMTADMIAEVKPLDIDAARQELAELEAFKADSVPLWKPPAIGEKVKPMTAEEERDIKRHQFANGRIEVLRRDIAHHEATQTKPLTSKVNAHSLTRGDMIMSDGKAWHVTGTRREGRTVLITVVDEEGNEHTISRGLNQPVDRVTGGRSGGSMTKAADPDQPHTGAMVALVPTEDDAQRLCVDGGEPHYELHVTLRYLGKGADFSDSSKEHLIQLVRDYAAQLTAFTAEAFNVAMFNPTGDEPCITLGLGGDDIVRAHNAVEAAIEDYGADLPEPHTPFVPHLTLVYTDDASMVEQLVDRVGPITFDRIRVAFGGVATDIPLGTQGITKAAEPGSGGADPKGQTPPPDQRWPGWAQDLAIAAATTAAIQAALTAARGLTTTALGQLASRALEWARGWLESRRPAPGLPVPGPGPRFRGTARVDRGGDDEPTLDLRGWLDSSTDLPRIIEEALTRPITDTWLQGYMVGGRSAQAILDQLEAGTDPRAAVSVDIDWGGWLPGDVAAARKILAADGSIDGWEAMLRDARAVIKGVTASRLKDIAKVLADGLERGDSPDAIAKALAELLGDRRKAYNIAITETNRAMSAATLDTYRAMDVAEISWMTALDQRVCPICYLNEFEAPGVVRRIPIGTRFPSGDYHPPAHPGGCRCALVPVLDIDEFNKAAGGDHWRRQARVPGGSSHGGQFGRMLGRIASSTGWAEPNGMSS
jgi:SPP1 gp7 family putative phage head morphogenesis protein